MKILKNWLAVGALLCSAPAAALNIFACEPEWQALAQEIAGDKADIYVATSAQQDPHRVQARPGLISAVRRADLVFCTGAGLEAGWLPLLLGKASNARVQSAPGLLLAAEHVTLLDKPAQLDRAEGDIHAAGNPHIHFDPRRILQVASVLAQQLQQLDPGNAAYYQARLSTFEATWREHIQQWESQAASLRGVAVIEHHRSWRYLLDWLGIQPVGELEPKPGIPPSPGHLQHLLLDQDARGARLILYAAINGDKASHWLASHSSACAVELPYTVGGDEDSASLSDFYATLVTRLVETLAQCPHE
ncbi:MAG: zinc ABC transporter substrate-binding protein [Alcanivoracaceae bacterium]|nr:zinc ABC transporter substrate-binding protein [Alcanivoracaceae bacterium]